MSLVTTLEDMRGGVRYAANVVAFTDNPTDGRIDDLINQGLGALSRVCRTTNPEFQPIASTTVTTDGVATTYQLPQNFRSLLSVEYTGDGFKTWLLPYELHERSALTTPDATATSTRAYCYRLIGTNIELLPKPPANHTAFLWYATSVTQLVDGAEMFDTMERLDSYVIWWAAREVASNREDWERVSYLSARMTELEGDIRILARSLDLSHPARPVQRRYAEQFDRYGRRRYR